MLTIFRRHQKDCRHRSRRFRRCGCPIHVEGTLAGERIRKALDLTSWEAASDLVRGWETSGEIGQVKKSIPELGEAVGKFIADAQARNLKPESIKKIRDVIERRLLKWASNKGIKHLRRIDVDTVGEFRNVLVAEYAPNSARKRLEYVRSFFRFCHQSGWIPTNPMLAIKAPKADERGVETFDRDEIDRMLAIADSFNSRGKFGPGSRKRVRAMILLLRYSGLRISDASILARDKLKDDAIAVRTIKTGAQIWCPLPKNAIESLNESPSDNPDYFFWNGRCKEKTAVTIWERTMTVVFERAGIPGEKRFLHNFRHTFATDLLTRGIPIEDVATLLGNSVRIVEKHYSHLVKARRDRIEERVRTLWA